MPNTTPPKKWYVPAATMIGQSLTREDIAEIHAAIAAMPGLDEKHAAWHEHAAILVHENRGGFTQGSKPFTFAPDVLRG